MKENINAIRLLTADEIECRIGRISYPLKVSAYTETLSVVVFSQQPKRKPVIINMKKNLRKHPEIYRCQMQLIQTSD